jgi:hypothetical protein
MVRADTAREGPVRADWNGVCAVRSQRWSGGVGREETGETQPFKKRGECEREETGGGGSTVGQARHSLGASTTRVVPPISTPRTWSNYGRQGVPPVAVFGSCRAAFPAARGAGGVGWGAGSGRGGRVAASNRPLDVLTTVCRRTYIEWNQGEPVSFDPSSKDGCV